MIGKTQNISKSERLGKELYFETEFMQHSDAVYNYALSLTKDVHQAQDLVQETMLKAFKYMYHFEDGTNSKAWLFRILYNTFVNDYRKNSKQPHIEDVDEAIKYKGNQMTTDGFLINLLDNGVGDEVNNALNSLSTDLRKIVILKDIEGFKYHEIAKIMDIPLGTVKSWLFKARQQLKTALKTYAYTRVN